MVGEALYWASSTLLGGVGAHIVAVFLFLAGVLLLTGASVAGVVKATSDSTTRVIQTGSEAVARRRAAADELRDLETRESRVTTAVAETPQIDDPPEFEPGVVPPEERDPRSGRARSASPTSTAASRAPRRSRRAGARAAAGAARARPGAVAGRGPGRGRAGRHAHDARRRPGPTSRRRAATAPESPTRPTSVWTVPDPRFLKRSSAEAAAPDTAGQEKIAAALIEALGHFGVQAQVIGMVAGPHITRYELRLAPGIKVGKVAQLKDDLAYALAAVRHPHPRARSRASRPSASRSPTPAGASCTSATSSRSRPATGRR